MSKDRQQEKARRSREKLLEAAGKLFSEKKISDVGVREIASAAGCTTGTFYHYFTGKDDMIDQLYQDHDIEMGRLLHQWAQEQGPYCDKIRTFFAQTLSAAVLADGWEFTCYRIFQMRKHSDDRDRLYMGMQELIQKAIDAGELQTDASAKEINGYLFVVFRGVLYEWCLCPPEQIFLLDERLKQMTGYALQSFQKK